MIAPVPAEWSAQKALWTAWPSHPELWPGPLLAAARVEIAGMINAIARHQPVRVLVCGDDALQSARQLLHGQLELINARFGDIWLRDTGPIFTRDGRALRFATNGWGGKYLYPHDDEVGDTVAARAGTAITRHPFVLEGGALEHNGEGLLMTTRQCLLNPNRNGWSQAEAEQALTGAFAASGIIWLDDGLLYDHTDGHIDNLARFVAPRTVVCQMASGADDPNEALYRHTASLLQQQGIDVVQIPSPGKVVDANGDIMPASHMNFIITNRVVVVPTYGTASADDALRALQALFPQHEVIGVAANAVLTGGGSFHCITQQEPAHD
ncbi:MAG TPA: agmatine deiminase family protein [Pseudomonadales bacterium]